MNASHDESDGAKPSVGPRISVLIPIYNEADNIPLLCNDLFQALDRIGSSYEVIAVDDGSRDGSLEALKAFAEKRRELKVISLRRNYGQTAAIMAGIDHAAGDILISIDADRQNDPAA